MSWMDSWSRPRKDQAVPAPFYLTQSDTVKYCHTCGRVIGARRANAAKTNTAEVKYCSDRCKRHKPSQAPESTERCMEDALIALLEGKSVNPRLSGDDDEETAPVKASSQPRKGDPRICVKISEIEEAVFGNRQDPEKTFGRRKNRARRGVPDGPEWKSVDMVDDGTTHARNRREQTDEDDDYSDGTAGSTNEEKFFETNGVSIRVRPPQTKSDVNFSVGGERGWAEKIEETPEMLQKRAEGAKRAEEKEMVKQMARRAVVFGLPVRSAASLANGKESKKKKGRRVEQDEDGDGDGQVGLRKCEALMNNAVVEPSFCKGDWSVRWREE